MIETVKGPIRKESLGITMCHEHVILDLSTVRGDTDSVLNDLDEISEEIEAYTRLGGKSLMEVTGMGMGRDVRKLFQVSHATGAHIVAATGFYLKDYHPQWLASATVDKVASLFVKEIQEGIDDTGIKAGIIGEVATSKDGMYPTEEKVLRAAARAHKKTGAPITTHCDMGRLSRSQCDLFKEEKVDPKKVVLGHMDLRDDLDGYEYVLKQGFCIGFDTIGKVAYRPDEKRADTLMALVKKGYQKQILLSQDISRKSYLRSNGGGGYTMVLKTFIPLLKEKGIDEEVLIDLLIHNPARLLNR